MKALVTGASSGIGRDIAIELSKKGYELILVARDEEKLKEVKESIKTKSTIICKDLSKVDNCIELYEEVKDVDVLVNNAGFGIFGEFSKTDLDKEINMINTNVLAVHTLTKLFLQKMKDKDYGYILNVSSIAGFMPGGPLMSAYYASKAYVLSLSEGIKEELAKEKSNIKISVLCPGPVRTNFNNVANVKFSLNSLSSDYVAKYAIDKMFKNKFIIMPGSTIRLSKNLAKIFPRNLTRKVVYYMQRKKIN